MKKKSMTSILILAIIGFIFTSDAVLLGFRYPTYSETISDWIQADTGNMIVFITGAVILCVHWVFGYYKNKK